jgi:hypothetical protein
MRIEYVQKPKDLIYYRIVLSTNCEKTMAKKERESKKSPEKGSQAPLTPDSKKRLQARNENRARTAETVKKALMIVGMLTALGMGYLAYQYMTRAYTFPAEYYNPDANLPIAPNNRPAVPELDYLNFDDADYIQLFEDESSFSADYEGRFNLYVTENSLGSRSGEPIFEVFFDQAKFDQFAQQALAEAEDQSLGYRIVINMIGNAGGAHLQCEVQYGERVAQLDLGREVYQRVLSRYTDEELLSASPELIERLRKEIAGVVILVIRHETRHFTANHCGENTPLEQAETEARTAEDNPGLHEGAFIIFYFEDIDNLVGYKRYLVNLHGWEPTETPE